VVLPLSLLDHGDEPHDNIDTEARSRSTAAIIASIPSQGTNSDFRANRRSIHSFRWSKTTHCEEAEGELVGRSDRHHSDQVPQQQDDRELQGQATECPSFRQKCNAMQGECNMINKFHIPCAMAEL
jgi:hypothetical protein